MISINNNKKVGLESAFHLVLANGGMVWLAPASNTSAHFVGSDREVAFRSPDNYPLSIVITYNNGTSPTKYTYEDLTIHIQSSDGIQQNRQNTILYAIGVVTFFFTMFDLLPKVAPKIGKKS